MLLIFFDLVYLLKTFGAKLLLDVAQFVVDGVEGELNFLNLLFGIKCGLLGFSV